MDSTGGEGDEITMKNKHQYPHTESPIPDNGVKTKMIELTSLLLWYQNRSADL